MRFKNIFVYSRIAVIILLITSLGSCSATKPSNWYYPWSNQINSMEAAADDEVIPALVSGQNYRILKIANFSGSVFNGFSYTSSTSSVELFQLPVMQDHGGKTIVDLIMPVKKGEAFTDRNPDKYFLVKFKGLKSGTEKINLTISSDKKSYSYSKSIKTLPSVYSPPVSLNVFAYFDYNFLVKDLKSKVIDDLVRHNTDVLVIPPAVLPDLSKGKTDVTGLRSYLKGTENKFKYYILYFNFNDHQIDLRNADLKKNIPVWHKNMMQVFEEQKVPLENVLLFPYDEPKTEQIQKLSSLYDHCRSVGIKNPFFVTVDSPEAAKVFVNKIEFIQMKPEFMKQVGTLNSKSRLWTYQLIYGSRDRQATEYRDMSITAFRHQAKGIGVWSYADIDRAVDQKGKSAFSRGTGTWDIDYSAGSAEYALIYRRNSDLFSSLRWEALSYGMEDYFWLQLYQNKFGKDKVQELLKTVDRFSEKERDAFKLKLMN